MILVDTNEVFSTRDIATGFWVLIGLGALLRSPTIRKSLIQVIRSASKWKLLGPVVLLIGYIVGILALLAEFGFRTDDLWKEIAFWFFFAGVAILFSGIDRAAEKRGFWRR